MKEVLDLAVHSKQKRKETAIKFVERSLEMYLLLLEEIFILLKFLFQVVSNTLLPFCND